MNDKGFLNILRGSVRPVIAYLVVGTLVAVVILLLNKWSNETMANKVFDAFMVIVPMVIGFYFASREAAKRK